MGEQSVSTGGGLAATDASGDELRQLTFTRPKVFHYHTRTHARRHWTDHRQVCSQSTGNRDEVMFMRRSHTRLLFDSSAVEVPVS